MYTLVMVIMFVVSSTSGEGAAITSQKITGADWTQKECEKEGERLAKAHSLESPRSRASSAPFHMAVVTWSCIKGHG